MPFKTILATAALSSDERKRETLSSSYPHSPFFPILQHPSLHFSLSLPSSSPPSKEVSPSLPPFPLLLPFSFHVIEFPPGSPPSLLPSTRLTPLKACNSGELGVEERKALYVRIWYKKATAAASQPFLKRKRKRGRRRRRLRN